MPSPWQSSEQHQGARSASSGSLEWTMKASCSPVCPVPSSSSLQSSQGQRGCREPQRGVRAGSPGPPVPRGWVLHTSVHTGPLGCEALTSAQSLSAAAWEAKLRATQSAFVSLWPSGVCFVLPPRPVSPGDCRVSAEGARRVGERGVPEPSPPNSQSLPGHLVCAGARALCVRPQGQVGTGPASRVWHLCSHAGTHTQKGPR